MAGPSDNDANAPPERGRSRNESTSSKPTLTEQYAAPMVIQETLRDVEAAWPGIYRSLQEEFGTEFIVYDERLAGFDLAITVIALNSQAIANVFPPDVAERTLAWTRRVLDSPEWGEYVLHELDAYTDAFQRGLEAPDPRDSMAAIAGRLLHRWLQERVCRFESVWAGERTGFLDPFLMTRVLVVLVSFTGRWKRLAQEYVIVP